MKEPLSVFMPGRLCLFGEHSDWAGTYRAVNPDIEPGYCLITATDQGIYAQVSRAEHTLSITSAITATAHREQLQIALSPENLLNIATSGGFFSYIAGTIYELLKRFSIDGIVIDAYKMDLPVKKGLSSSAAICMLTVRAYNELYQLQLSIPEEMEIAYRGELLAGSQCGKMDQACAYNQPVFLIFDGTEMYVEPLAAGSSLYFVIVDLQATKDTRKILTDLNACFPNKPNLLSVNVRQALGQINKETLYAARSALLEGNAPVLGSLMRHAQSVFDRYVAPACPSELNAPKLHQVLSFEAIQELIFGGKGVGSQGDGTAQFLCRGIEEQKRVCELLEHDLDVRCLPLTIPGVSERSQL